MWYSAGTMTAHATSKRLDVIVAGDIYCDLIFGPLARFPRMGEELRIRDFICAPGGGTSIAAVALSRLGLRTGIVACVGKDPLGDFVIKSLAQEKVDVSWIRRVPGPTSITVAMVFAHDRCFVTHEGANRRFPRVLMESAMRRHLRMARHVHLAWRPTMARSTIRLLQALRRWGTSTSLDTGWDETLLASRSIRDILPHVDFFLPNLDEARKVAGCRAPSQVIERLSGFCRNLVIKLGARGSVGLLDDGRWRGAPRPTRIVDTTGSGDAFDAGFLAAYLRGKPPAERLLMGNICGSRAASAYGGIAGLPRRAAVERELHAAATFLVNKNC